MTIHLPVRTTRTSAIATVAAALVATLVVAAKADAASTRRAPVLAEGAGMGAKPSTQVRQLQRALQRRGFGVGAPGADGRFGPLTAAAVRRLQVARGLAVDGIVGARTRAALGLRRRAASAAQRSSRAQPTTTPAPSSQPASKSPSAATAPASPGTVTILDRADGGSKDGIVSVLFYAVLGALAALGLASVGRRVVPRERPERTAHALPARVPRGEPMIGYVTPASAAWSDEHERSAEAIEAICERSDWELVDMVWDRENGSARGRPGLSQACERIARGQARGLVVSDLQRLSRSPQEIDSLLAFLHRADATLVALDLQPDTSMPAGRQRTRALTAYRA